MEKENKLSFDFNKVLEFANTNLKGCNYILFINIAFRCNVNNNSWVHSDSQWIEELNMSKNAFHKAKKYLEENKYIVILNKGKKNSVNSNEVTNYGINVSKIDTLKPTTQNEVTPTTQNGSTPTTQNEVHKKEVKNKENNCSINSTVVKENGELKRKVEILEEEHSYFDEDDKRLFDMRQAFKHINSDDSWVDRYFNTLNKIDGVKLTTPMRVLIGGQIDTLYDDRPNDNFETDFKVLRNRLQTPNYYQMKTNITQADRETAL